MHNFKKWLQINENADWGEGGWKIHLRTGLDDKNRQLAYDLVKQITEKPVKKLDGGDPDSKDITIYCGTKSEADKVVTAISENPELSVLLLPPSEEVQRDDIQMAPGTNIYGRFNAARLDRFTGGTEFHQYGCKGHSMLKSHMDLYTGDRRNLDKTKSCQTSYQILKNIFGKDFTG